MKSFLDEIAEQLLKDQGNDLGNITLVFPNKRAGIFFTRALSQRVNKPVWSPRIFSIEDFIYSLSDRMPADRVALILNLYQAYRDITGFEETFDRFYFWGEMLLNDFDEIDKYLVKPEHIFSSVKNLKEIDATFPFLTDEQKEIITNFWGNLSSPKSESKERFLRFWSSLPEIYESFRGRLSKKGTAYTGMVYRDVCKRIENGELKWQEGPVIFAGFNALTKSEEYIIKWFVESNGGRIFWDTDSAYLTNPWHEAGIFHRRYLNDPVLRNTFPKKFPDNIKNNDPEVEIISTASNTSQVQWAAKKISGLLTDGLLDKPEKTAIVLPDESLVMPELFSLPPELKKVNITIAYPVKTVPFFSFFELIIELQENRRHSSKGTWFSHMQVLPLLSNLKYRLYNSNKIS